MKIDSVDSPVTDSMIFICEKCGGKDLQQYMKSKIKDDGKKGVVRAVISGCMDICPKNAIAICVSKPAEADKYLVVSGKIEDIAGELL